MATYIDAEVSMDLLSVFRGPARAMLRVDAEAGPAAFDALVIVEGRRGGMESRTLRDAHTPFSLALPDEDVTVVVQPRDPARPVVAEYARERGGRRVLWGRSWAPMPVLRRRGGAILCAGLPSDGPDGESDAGVTAPAI
jgi:hypothetical protein